MTALGKWLCTFGELMNIDQNLRLPSSLYPAQFDEGFFLYEAQVHLGIPPYPLFD